MANILIYDTQGESKIDSLWRVFSRLALAQTGLTLARVTAHTLCTKLTEQVDLLVLPGTRAGTTYREQLTGPSLQLLQQRVQDGLQILGICAGAYVLARTFIYTEYEGLSRRPLWKKQISSPLGLADVMAQGPDLRLYAPQPRDPNNPWSVYSAVELEGGAIDAPSPAFFALSRGPSFVITNPQAAVALVNYKATREAAVVQFRQGDGGGILAGPALEVGGTNLRHYIYPPHYTQDATRDIVEKLEQSRMAWSLVWEQLLPRLLPRQTHTHGQIRSNFLTKQMSCLLK